LVAHPGPEVVRWRLYFLNSLLVDRLWPPQWTPYAAGRTL